LLISINELSISAEVVYPNLHQPGSRHSNMSKLIEVSQCIPKLRVDTLFISAMVTYSNVNVSPLWF